MPLNGEQVNQINQAIPVISGDSDSKDAPLGATVSSSHVHFEGGAAITGLPNAIKASQAPRWSQVLSLVKTVVNNAVLALANYVDNSLAGFKNSVESQLNQKASQADLVGFQEAIQSQLNTAQLGFKHLVVNLIAIATSPVVIGNPLPALNGVPPAAGDLILLNAQPKDQDNGFYVVINPVTGQLTRASIPLPAGSVVFFTGKGNLAGAYCVLQGSSDIKLGTDPIKFSIYTRPEAPQFAVDGMAIKLNGSVISFDTNTASNLILQLLGLKPPKLFLAGDGKSTQILIPHNLGATSFLYSVKDLVRNQTLPLAALQIVDDNNVQLNVTSPPDVLKLEILLFPFVGAGTSLGASAPANSDVNNLTDSSTQKYLTNDNGNSYLIY